MWLTFVKVCLVSIIIFIELCKKLIVISLNIIDWNFLLKTCVKNLGILCLHHLLSYYLLPYRLLITKMYLSRGHQKLVSI